MRPSVALVLALTACGSSTAAVLGTDAGSSRDGAGGEDGAAPDSTVPDGAVGVGVGADAGDAGADENDANANGEDSTAPYVDAGCTDDGLPPGRGAPFACGTETCFSQSQYCTWSVGGIRRGSQPAIEEPKVGFFSAGQ